jgi:hypothetical protein
VRKPVPQHSSQKSSVPAAKQPARPVARIAEKAGPNRNGISRAQPQIGNRAMGRLLAPLRIQPKLMVAPSNDYFEREADRVADVVVRAPGPTGKLGLGISRMASAPAQRSCAACDEEKLQRAAAEDTRYLQRKCSQCEDEQLQRKEAGDIHYLQRKCSACARRHPAQAQR